MLNINSPTVQAMLNNTPNGIGNMPVYFGNPPTVTQTIESQPSQPVMPFPSPKEMLQSAGNNTIYGTPTQFSTPPRNLVGAYNPGFQTAFQDYSNPYMGVGSYSGYSMPSYGYNPYYMDDWARETYEVACSNGLSYMEQLEQESDVLKSISGIVSKNLGRSEEVTERCKNAFSVYDRYTTPNPNDPYSGLATSSRIKPLHIKLKEGDDVVLEVNPNTVSSEQQDRIINFYKHKNSNLNVMLTASIDHNNKVVAAMNYLYDHAPERRFDNVDLIDFFNYGAGVLMADTLDRELRYQNTSLVGMAYDKEKFKRILEANGCSSKRNIRAVERFTGRYGIMPDGRPVSPGHDPEIATCFSYDPKTNQYTVTAPNFIQNRLETARARFIESIN